ncbi:hypothetical protein HDU87_002052 [Geranomyces variabilis]|uniref:Uncharacterized protein n=1 Tax=Geranomyces variabilis TaxID=109894 RepID=A0AAD5TMV8_9FUNG|nr:hypothetical protein HDU87_002052 [Geranomyces variabilis]
MITKNAGESIVDIANRIKGALKLKPYARTVFNTVKAKGLEDVPFIRAIVDSIRKSGTPGFWKLMGGGSEATDEICEDEDVWYLVRCFVAMERYFNIYAGQKDLTERTFDWHSVHEFTTVPFSTKGPTMQYGEKMSVADHCERQRRTGDIKKRGKFVDFLYQVAEFEHAVGESSELEGKPGFIHVRENHSDLPKIARSQLTAT